MSPSNETNETTGVASTTPAAPSTTTNCPIGQLNGDQIALVCPTGFRRHPKYCNLFYQCTNANIYDIKVAVLSCPNGTIYDDDKIQCLPREEAKHCAGEIAHQSLYKKVDSNSLPPVSYK